MFAVQGLAMFFSAFIVALCVQWKLSLITLTIVPAIFLLTSIAIAIESINEIEVVKI